MAYGDSTSASLTAVRAAIDRCLQTQAYTIRGRSQQLAELKQLRALEISLMSQTDEEANSGAMCQVATVDSPT